MRTLALAICYLALARGACSQEPIPTVEVCRADYATWHDTTEMKNYYVQETQHISNGTTNTNPIVRLSVRQISRQLIEMSMCISVDVPNKDNYYEMQRFFDDVLTDRYRSFLARHNLWQQFTLEDAAGER